MKWLIILFILDGEPAFNDGWLPRQYDDCKAASTRITEYLGDEVHLIGCFDNVNRANVSALAATYGEPV